jgi:hypothetical protein
VNFRNFIQAERVRYFVLRLSAHVPQTQFRQ